MRTLFAIFALIASLLSFDTIAHASDPSGSKTNYIMALDGVPRPRVNPDYCGRWASDYFCKAGLTSG